MCGARQHATSPGICQRHVEANMADGNTAGWSISRSALNADDRPCGCECPLQRAVCPKQIGCFRPTRVETGYPGGPTRLQMRCNSPDQENRAPHSDTMLMPRPLGSEPNYFLAPARVGRIQAP